MKKSNIFSLIIAFSLAVTFVFGTAFAEQDTEEQVIAVLSENGLRNPKQIQVWGDIAACFADQNGGKVLCLLEKQDDCWKIDICNQKALLQDEPLPTLVLDSDNSVFWTYLYQDKAVRFHADRKNSRWGHVDETASFSRGEAWHTYTVAWSDENGGEIRRSAIIEDENGNNLLQGHTVEYLPASWLNNCISLDTFDLLHFPSVGFSGDYSASWPGQTFLAEAAAHMMPDEVYINGIYKSGKLHFLMEKPDGKRIYTVCYYADNVPRIAELRESSILPQNTYLGVENFSDSLGIAVNGAVQAVSIRSFPHDSGAGIDTIWNFDDESPLVFGKNCFYSGINNHLIWYGHHLWQDFSAIRWESVPMSIEAAKNGFNSAGFAVVNNPNPKERLHLREKPDKDSRSLGKYYNGTPVHVNEVRGDWACVYIGDQLGWMMKKYLTFGTEGKPLLCDTSAMPKLTARNNYELKVFIWPKEENLSSSVQYVNAFSDPVYHNMKIIGLIGDDWYHVWFPESDEYGYVKQSDLWLGNG